MGSFVHYRYYRISFEIYIYIYNTYIYDVGGRERCDDKKNKLKDRKNLQTTTGTV